MMDCMFCNGDGEVTIEVPVSKERAREAGHPDIAGDLWFSFVEDCPHCDGSGVEPDELI